MKKTIFLFCVFCLFFNKASFAQRIISNDTLINQAYDLAVNTVNINVRRGILAAGSDYGGEWTRDIAINCWNGLSLLKPEVAEKSLWSVTVQRDTIGHQYWDKIIWVIGAYQHYLTTGNRQFLEQAYICSANTMQQMENTAFDSKYGLFKGPSVFNDGIAAYPEPVYQPNNLSADVLAHNSSQIKCLSTNCVYYGAYVALAKMAALVKAGNPVILRYTNKAAAIKQNILQHLYDSKTHKLYYLIDQNGQPHEEQEGLGISFSVLLDIVPPDVARQLTRKAVVSKFGITSIYPDFPRYSTAKPGRHNNIAWPMVSGFFGLAALNTRDTGNFNLELNSLTHLALDEDKGNYNFREVYNPYSGQPDGGWQDHNRRDYHWESFKGQTWSATAYIALILKGVIGLEPMETGMKVHPYLPVGIGHIEIRDLHYRNCILDISVSGAGESISTFEVDGKPQHTFVLSPQLKGQHLVTIRLNHAASDN